MAALATAIEGSAGVSLPERGHSGLMPSLLRPSPGSRYTSLVTKRGPP
jgi:hypothetical protein